MGVATWCPGWEDNDNEKDPSDSESMMGASGKDVVRIPSNSSLPLLGEGGEELGEEATMSLTEDCNAEFEDEACEEDGEPAPDSAVLIIGASGREERLIWRLLLD